MPTFGPVKSGAPLALAASNANATITPPGSSSVDSTQPPTALPSNEKSDEQAFVSVVEPSKGKRKKDQRSAAADSGGKRRSLRDRDSITTPVAGKLSPMEIIGSLTFDIARSNEGWKVKERGVTRTYVSDCGKMTFDSFEAIGEYAIADKDRMEKLADDEGAMDSLQRLARDGEKRAIAALEGLGISVEEDDEYQEEDVVHTAAAPPAELAAAAPPKAKAKAKSKSRAVIGLSKADYSIADGEIAKFRDRLGEFLTVSVDMFFDNFASIVSRAESKLEAKNARTLEEIKKLEVELEAAPPLEWMHSNVRSDLEERMDEVKRRKAFHELRVRKLVKELAGRFLASGFALPEHLERKHGELLRRYPVLKTAFPAMTPAKKAISVVSSIRF